MSILVRRDRERGRLSLDWLQSTFTFSFADYYDPRHLGFGALRALNEHLVAPGGAFDTARRADLEVISYVCDGALRHWDSLGNETVIGPGGVQRLSAGRGVTHRESNESGAAPLRFVQIWILPEVANVAPGYESRVFHKGAPSAGMRLLASRDGRQGSLTIGRDVDLFNASLPAGDVVAHPLGFDREAWVQVLDGAASLNGTLLARGDGAGVHDVDTLRIDARTDVELLVFDMARG